MDYYLYNTDRKSTRDPNRYHILINRGFAATSGPLHYGMQLGRLAPADMLLMYENRVGVVAIGEVQEYWDRKRRAPPWFYRRGDEFLGHEYRIGVDWFCDVSKNPIGVQELKKRIGFIPLSAMVKIVKRRAEVEKLIAERCGAKSALVPGERLDETTEESDRTPSGAGFGNAVENKEVEVEAIALVTKGYKRRGWRVCSKERDRYGFDLECRKDGKVENVEVKGVRGAVQSFFISAGEVKQAQTNRKFVLVVVASALSASPVLTRYSGTEFCRKFKLSTVISRAVLREP